MQSTMHARWPADRLAKCLKNGSNDFDEIGNITLLEQMEESSDYFLVHRGPQTLEGLFYCSFLSF